MFDISRINDTSQLIASGSRELLFIRRFCLPGNDWERKMNASFTFPDSFEIFFYFP